MINAIVFLANSRVAAVICPTTGDKRRPLKSRQFYVWSDQHPQLRSDGQIPHRARPEELQSRHNGRSYGFVHFIPLKYHNTFHLSII